MAKCLICYKTDLPDGEHYHPACARKFFGTEKAPQLDYKLSDMRELAGRIVRSHGIMTGVQPKISLGLEKTKKELGRLTVMMGEFILKPPSEQYPQMPETEDLTMHLAGICRISVVPHALVPLASGELSYITRRIDRNKKGKIHLEDFCQLSGLLTEDKYKSSMERVGKLVRSFSMYPGLDAVNIFELTLFNYVTGNNDMHLKNFSLIDNGLGWSLSPAYDLLNVNLVNAKDTEESALTINGKKKRLRKEDFRQLGVVFSLNEPQVKNAFQKILDNQAPMSQFIKGSFLSDDFKTKYIQILAARCRELS